MADRSRALQIAGAALGIAAAGAGAYFVWFQVPHAGSAEQTFDMLSSYCTDCHNRAEYTAEIAFDALNPGSVASEPKVFEAAVRKLRGHMMPPPGNPQPDGADVAAAIDWLEGALDEAAAAQPNPGRVALHRLNRTEYANAIDDLFGLEIDAAALLPKDDESDGFDNVANVLKVSPSFLDQYIAAARAIAQLAVGDPAVRRDSRVYYAPATLNQNYHVEGMPLGTRGGMLVEHFFPADGTYEVSLGGLARARYVEGLEYRHRLIVTVDGKKVFENEIGGPEDLEAVDLRQAAAVAEINGRFENIRVPVTAGPHRIGATFVARTMAESDAPLEPFVPGGGEVGIIEGEESPLKIVRLEIEGPYDATGVGDTPSRRRIFVCRPSTAGDEEPCARQIVAKLARQAFRRPVTDDDLATPLEFYRRGRALGDFETGIRTALTMVLASPEFLYRIESPPAGAAPGSIYPVDDLALASRLSFFLWSGLPDEELLTLAERRELGKPDVLAAQVRRMLADPKAESLVTNFAVQWLDIRNVTAIAPDPVLFPEYDANLGSAFAEELQLFLKSVLLEDRSVLELLDGRETFVNERLALHYGIGSVRGDAFRRVTLEDPNRFGLFGKGGVLLATSYPNRTAPVLRGAWILEALTGTPPAAPPPDVEAFPENEEGVQPKTVRERLEAHRTNPTCNACHGVMDPLGFALENFDAIGQWRTKDRDAGEAIDSTGQLADGTAVSGPQDLREALLDRPDQVVQTLTEKLLIYALGRGVEYYDMPAVRKVVRDAARDDYRFAAVVTGIVTSEPFRFAVAPSASGVPADDRHGFEAATAQ
jgi:mono/diheme cytochrome c family protein